MYYFERKCCIIFGWAGKWGQYATDSMGPKRYCLVSIMTMKIKNNVQKCSLSSCYQTPSHQYRYLPNNFLHIMLKAL